MWVLKKLIAKYFTPKCAHKFHLDDLKQTGIPEPESPAKDADRATHSRYLRLLHNGEGARKRVMWPCHKCGQVFYGRSGLDISEQHGPIISRGVA